MLEIKRKEIVVLFLMVVLIPSALTMPVNAASPATVLGTVKTASGSPISNVMVTLKIGSVVKDTDYTDANGLYDVTCSISVETLVTLVYTKSGYDTYTTTAYVSPGYFTIKNVVMTLSTTQGVQGVVKNTNGNPVSNVKVNLYIGGALISTKYTSSSGAYSFYCAVASPTTVTLKFYDHNWQVKTTTATVNPGAYTTKNVVIPNQYDVSSRIDGKKTYKKLVASPSTYAQFGIDIENLRLSYHTCPDNDDVTFVDFYFRVSTTWDTTWFWGDTLECVLGNCDEDIVFLGKYRAMGDYWDPGDDFIVSGNLAFTSSSWTNPYFTIKFMVGSSLLSEKIYMLMKFKIDDISGKWTEYYDRCYRTYGWVTERIYPPVVVDTWAFPQTITLTY
ncbi:MAG: carboxypeptidase-like regulatory domain-containing protein [Candidatus Thorarchaeota archaeon]